MQQDVQFGFIVAYVDDIQAAKRFYVDVLGFKVEREAPNFVQFDHFAIASDESMDGRRQLEPYWLVADAEAAFKELRGKAQIHMDLQTKPFGKVFAVSDPTGQARYFVELARTRPSVQVSTLS
jgi:catechol 2,3-dioxygenase-like lactoylglutathione lyase family enzyme